MANTPSTRVKPRSLTVAFFNAFGLKRQRDEVAVFLRDHLVDILLVQETLLKSSTRRLNIANYNTIRDDRPTTHGGGTAIYYKRSLHCMPIDTPQLESAEASVCRLAMTGHQPITIASFYHSPNRVLVESDLKALLDLDSAVIVAGDFNSKHQQWNARSTSQNGIRLDTYADKYNFDVIAPMAPTHYPHNTDHTPDVLDIAILKNVTLQFRSIEVVHELNSDHRPVLLNLGPPPVSLNETKKIVDWNRLKEALKATSSPSLDKIPSVLNTKEDSKLAINALTTHLQTVVNDCSREVPVTGDRRWKLPDDVRGLLRAKNAATRAYDSYPTDDNRIRMRALQRDVKARIAQLRDDGWDTLMLGIKPSHQAYWKLARALKSETVSVMPPLTRPNLPPAFLDEDKAECLADSLESQCSPSTLPCDQAHLDMVNAEVERRTAIPLTESLSPVSETEVQSLIKKLRDRKAPGADGISNKVVKQLSAPLICLLTAIFNVTMTCGIFPSEWKEADVIGLPKPGKPASAPSSYRPISLLNTLGKLYERILSKRLWDFISSKGILQHEQFGFRANHSCVQQVHRITEYILNSSTRFKRVGTGALFFDVAKAFDKVWHNGLIYKLYQLNVPDRLVLILRDYLTDRSFRYRVEGSRSSPHPIRAGVPQGSVLSPILYSLYTNDFPRTPKVEVALFADDTALYTRGSDRKAVCRRLQSAAISLGEWFKKWRIEVNPEKSAAMYFTKGNLETPTFRTVDNPIFLFDRPIPWVKHVKYLGVTLDMRLSFHKHVRRVRNRAAFVLGRLYPLLCSKSKMSITNKTTIFKTCIRPILTYSSVAFAHASPGAIHKLQIIQNRFMRRAKGAPWFLRNKDLHHDFNLPTIAQYFKQASKRYFDRIPHHPNPLLKQACAYTAYNVSSIKARRPKHVLLDPDDYITTTINAVRPIPRLQTRRRNAGSAGRPRYFHVPGRQPPSSDQPTLPIANVSP